MQAEILARFIIGVIGNAIAVLRYISPMPIFWRIMKKKSTEFFHPYPYLATVMSSLMWLIYALPVVHSANALGLILTCSIGLFFQILYLTIFFIYSPKYRVTIIAYLLGEVVVAAVVTCITVLCLHTLEKRSMFVGILADIVGIIMYASPLSVLEQVWKTKSSEFIPFWLCLTCFFNAISWATYSLLKYFDVYLLVSSGMGTVLSFIQLCVYFYYKPKHN